MPGIAGLARIDRLPRARGPHSLRPWYQPHDTPTRDEVGHALDQVLPVERARPQPRRGDGARALGVGVLGTPVRMGHVEPIRLPQDVVPDVVGRPERGPIVRGSTLDIGVLEHRLTKEASVHHAVECASTRVREACGAWHEAVERIETVGGDLLESSLGGSRDVLLPLGQCCLAVAGSTEQVGEPIRVEAPHEKPTVRGRRAALPPSCMPK